MKKLLFFKTALAFLLASCSSNISDDIKYEIITEVPNPGISKCNLDVRLNKKVSQETLDKIAIELRKNREQFNKLWIGYYLPGMIPGSGAWATSNFTPEKEIQIFGSTIEQDKTLDSVTVDKGEIIGRWEDYNSALSTVHIIYKINDSLKLKRVFIGNSMNSGEIIEDIIRVDDYDGKARFNYLNDNKEHFIVEKDGNLGFYNSLENRKFGEGKLKMNK